MIMLSCRLERASEAMEDADKALAHNKLSTKAIIAKVIPRFFLKFILSKTNSLDEFFVSYRSAIATKFDGARSAYSLGTT